MKMFGQSICVTWLKHICGATHSYVWHDSFVCLPLLQSYVWLGQFIYVAWLIHMCSLLHAKKKSKKNSKKMRYTMHACVTWRIHMCDMTYSHVWHDLLAYWETRFWTSLWNCVCVCVWACVYTYNDSVHVLVIGVVCLRHSRIRTGVSMCVRVCVCVCVCACIQWKHTCAAHRCTLPVPFTHPNECKYVCVCVCVCVRVCVCECIQW